MTIKKKSFVEIIENKIGKKNYKNAVYLLMILMGIGLASISYWLPVGIWQSIIINVASNLITTGIFIFFIIDRLLDAQNEKNRKRNEQEIKIILLDKDSNERFVLPTQLSRREFTRNEVFGRIGMLPRIGEQFKINYLKSPECLVEINKILGDDKYNEFEILCTRSEVEQGCVSLSKKKNYSF